MKYVKVDIDLNPKLLKRIDAKAKKLKISRSELVRRIVDFYIQSDKDAHGYYK